MLPADDIQRRFTNDPKRKWKMFLDFDSFFAHVEKQDHPELWGSPVAVAPTPSPHSGVIGCCYAAKALGVKRGMKRAEATALAPGIVFRHARHDLYIEIHQKILEVIEAHVPVEKAWCIKIAFGRIPDYAPLTQTAKKMEGSGKLTA